MAELAQRCQTTVSRSYGVLGLPVLSPYFHTNNMREEAAGRDTKLSLTSMKAVYVKLDNFSDSNKQIDVIAEYASSAGSFSSYAAAVDISTCSTYEDIRTAVNAFVIANAPSTITESDIQWPTVSPALAGLKNAPQAAIANAPADATTNYNVLTTILGTLVGAVNTANTKQNDIATKLNSLLSELRTLGLIST